MRAVAPLEEAGRVTAGGASQISDAAVIGRPDEEAGEIPVAYVVAKDLEVDAVMQFVAERVSHYKQVRVVNFVDEIPKSASGKILRRELVAADH